MNKLYAHRFHDGEIVLYYDALATRRACSWTANGNPDIPPSAEFVVVGNTIYLLEWI